jgi:hypothetical protein
MRVDLTTTIDRPDAAVAAVTHVPAFGVHRAPLRALAVTLLIAVVFYFVLARVGTWPGITQAAATLPALGLIGLVALAWLLARGRIRAPFTFAPTPLDRALPLWLAAFAVSTAANLPMIAYIRVGLWFAGLYIAVWYLLHDALAHRLLRPQRLLDGLLGAAVPVIASALLEFARRRPPRVSGLLENPNILGAFLVLVIPIAFVRLLAVLSPDAEARQDGPQLPARLVAGLFYGGVLIAAIGTLALTGSRGGILGACCAFGFILFRRSTTVPQKAAVVTAGLILTAALYGIRGDSGRMTIYERGLNLISREFLTGQGLFTFRRIDPGAVRSLKLPPDGQNLHAHNIGLQIAIELGLSGILALALTVNDFVRSLRRGGLRPYQEWAFAAAFGLLIQQIGDFTVMTPSIGLCFVVLLTIATVDPGPLAGTGRRGARWVHGLLFLLVIALVAALIGAGIAAGSVPRSLL